MLSAVVQNAPPQITLNWNADPNATQYQIFRKLKAVQSWGTILATIPGTAIQYVDNNVSIATSYEYKLVKSAGTYTGYGYINSGIEIPVTEIRGTIILVVDSTFTVPLAAELSRLEKDLEGDGWKVIRHDVSRTMPVASVKSMIVNDYNSNPASVKALFLLGHIAVPYSGNFAPDGHVPDHQGAWPADVFYGEMNGNWTDVTVNNTGATGTRQDNIPGDGKYDQSSIPSNVELQVGRVDFFDLPAFPLSEEMIMKNYLDKDHDYRNKNFSVQKRAVIDDNFGYFGGEAFAASGWKNFSVLVGPQNVSSGDYFTTLSSGTYQWSYGCGGGSYIGASGIGNTTDLSTSNLQTVFTMLFGSYFGDWDSQNNFLRAPLAQGYTLTNVWSGRPHWGFHHMGLGENIGYSTLISQNNQSLYFANNSSRQVHIALMGDPTLRSDIIAPATNFTATISGNTAVLNWTASADTVLGYNIYLKNDSINNFVRINSSTVIGTTYTDTCLLYPGIYTYMVRALKLETTASGTYFNLSQGVCDTAYNTNYLAVTAFFTYTSNNNIITFINQSVNGTSYQWNFGDAATSALQNPVHTYTANGTYTVTLIASNQCGSDTITNIISIATGLEENSDLITVEIFPNPSNGQYQVKIKGVDFENTELELFNLTGEIVFKTQLVRSETLIDISFQPNGVYFVKLKTEKGSVVKKIVLSR